MASPGYGKRSTPDQAPPAPTDFAHLPDREAAIAAYIDRLPDGADMSVKTLAKVLPHGQCALRTALNAIQRAGHLRRGRDPVFTESDGIRWVTRTWFSRTPRDDAWWAAFAGQVGFRLDAGGLLDAGGRVQIGGRIEVRTPVEVGVPGEVGVGGPVGAGAGVGARGASGDLGSVAAGDAVPVVAPGAAGAGTRAVPAPRVPVGERSPAYGVLATLGQRNSAVLLSADDCDALEPLALEWFERGWGAEDLRRALTEALPFPVHHPAGFVRKRLVMKMPPELPPESRSVTARRVLQCGTCGKDVRADLLVGGDCRACRGGPAPVGSGAVLDPDHVRALAAQVRAAVRDAEHGVGQGGELPSP